MTIALIAAVARNGVIGAGNTLLWRLPEDARFFREQTQGHPVVMGRRTWDSLPERFRPLPGRLNVVVTRQSGWSAPGAVVAGSLDEALAQAEDAPVGSDTIFVIGGAQVYAEALPLADRLVLTEIERDFEGEVRFPPWEHAAFREVSRQRHHAAPPNDFDFSFVVYERRPL
jgi:dihydrofolate reductase